VVRSRSQQDHAPVEFPKDAVTATNTIHHERLCASRILAPVPVAAR